MKLESERTKPDREYCSKKGGIYKWYLTWSESVSKVTGRKRSKRGGGENNAEDIIGLYWKEMGGVKR